MVSSTVGSTTRAFYAIGAIFTMRALHQKNAPDFFASPKINS